MINKVIEHLSKLREKYRQHRVSVMVGAGFSKNACTVYPSWDELLYDMVVELYQEDINVAFKWYLSLNPLTKNSIDVFTKKEVERIISKTGPLKLVSEFIERKGFRESIEHYIEERIPYIDKVNNLFRFSGKNENKTITIIPDYFAAHKKLVKMRGWNRVYTTNYDKLLEYAAEIDGTEYKSVTNAKDLSVYSDKVTIIKLHGDLYDPIKSKGKRIYRFDGNPHQQYIISAEDYMDYPKEHEAFTQLMRIYLLQGVFCLIGFSGDDPNFMNWIEWVRDIIEREFDPSEERDDDYKIYLIGLSDSLPSQDKLIFYENHSIVYIPLLHDKVKEAIGTDPSNNDIRDLFCYFFNYLEPDEIPQTEEGDDMMDLVLDPSETNTPINKQDLEKKHDNTIQDVEPAERKEYLSLWNKVYEFRFNKVSHTYSFTIDEKVLLNLRDIKIWNRFVNYSYRQKHYLDDVWSQKKLTASEAELAILALRDTGITVDSTMVDLLSKADIDNDSNTELKKLVDRAKTLYLSREEDGQEDVNPYERIVRELFALNFEGAKKILDDWNPTGVDLQKKALLLSFFGGDGASDMLIDYIQIEPNPKEQFYATRLLNLVEGTFTPKHSVTRFLNTNVQDYFEVLSNYLKRVRPDEEKIRRYGDGKNEKVIHIGDEPNKIAEAEAVLNFLIEAPALITHKNFFTIVKAGDWYPVHKTLFEKFPYATLFYSIQCTDKKIRTRIGQDYAYSDQLASTCLDTILCNLLRAFLSEYTPAYLKEAILAISKEMFVSVSSAKWERLFMNIWEDVVLRSRYDNKESRLNESFDSFVFKGLNSVKTLSIRQKVLRDVLERTKKDAVFSINCLYYLKIEKRDGKGNKKINDTIDGFISSISLPEEIIIAGNISKILTEKQKNTVANKCVDVFRENMGKKIDSVVYHSAQFFIKNDSNKRKVYLGSVCNSPLLWNNGISSNGSMFSFTYLKVTNFIHKIYIDQQSLNKIYTKMQESLNKVLMFFNTHKTLPFIGDFDGLLSEMLSFLNYFESRLKTHPDFIETYDKVKYYLQEMSGVRDIEDGLYSVYEGDLRDAMDYIFVNRDTLTHKEIVHYSGIMINRVLMRNSDGLDSCVAYLRLYLENGLIDKEDESLMAGLVSILDKFSKEIAQDCNMELVMTTRDLAKIGKKLTKYGFKSEGIKYWVDLHKSSRFVTNFD